MTEGLLTVAQVAELTQLNHQAVRRAIARGELPALKLCGRIRIERDAFDAWQRAHRVTHRGSQDGVMYTGQQERRSAAGLKRLLDN